MGNPVRTTTFAFVAIIAVTIQAVADDDDWRAVLVESSPDLSVRQPADLEIRLNIEYAELTAVQEWFQEHRPELRAQVPRGRGLVMLGRMIDPVERDQHGRAFLFSDQRAARWSGIDADSPHLQIGDVIRRAGRDLVDDAQSFHQALAQADLEPGDELELIVVRQVDMRGRSRSLTGTVSETVSGIESYYRAALGFRREQGEYSAFWPPSEDLQPSDSNSIARPIVGIKLPDGEPPVLMARFIVQTFDPDLVAARGFQLEAVTLTLGDEDHRIEFNQSLVRRPVIYREREIVAGDGRVIDIVMDQGYRETVEPILTDETVELLRRVAGEEVGLRYHGRTTEIDTQDTFPQLDLVLEAFDFFSARRADDEDN